MKKSSLLAPAMIGSLGLFVTANSVASEANDHPATASTSSTSSTSSTAPTSSTTPSDDRKDATPAATIDDLGAGERLRCFLRLGKCTDPRF